MLLEGVARLFRDEAAYLVADRSLLFVCGGPVEPDSYSLRKQFLSYAADALPNFRIFLAEAARQQSQEKSTEQAAIGDRCYLQSVLDNRIVHIREQHGAADENDPPK